MLKGVGCAAVQLVIFESPPGTHKSPADQNAVQAGIRYRLEVFRTAHKGWGVRSWDRIPAGAFVCEFAGTFTQIPANSAASARGWRSCVADLHAMIATLLIFTIQCLSCSKVAYSLQAWNNAACSGIYHVSTFESDDGGQLPQGGRVGELVT